MKNLKKSKRSKGEKPWLCFDAKPKFLGLKKISATIVLSKLPE
tara:strand:- start:89 stop:217 length:129 start_codon:yes stop_codon:yes gene_type:complete